MLDRINREERLTLGASGEGAMREPDSSDADMLSELSKEAARISRALASLAKPGSGLRRQPVDAQKEAKLSVPEISARFVRDIIRQRRAREQDLPANLFADPAWDILLDLTAARIEQKRVSVSSLCIAAAVPSTTALR